MKLYMLISDCGDGSYSLSYTLNPELIAKLQRAYDEDLMDYENGIGVDGDGFSYSTINVPDDSTAESLGIYCMLEDGYADRFFQEEDMF